MKRSDMTKLLVKTVKEAMERGEGPLDIADSILPVILKAGMLPPERSMTIDDVEDSVIRQLAKMGMVYDPSLMKINEWEPE